MVVVNEIVKIIVIIFIIYIIIIVNNNHNHHYNVFIQQDYTINKKDCRELSENTI